MVCCKQKSYKPNGADPKNCELKWLRQVLACNSTCANVQSKQQVRHEDVGSKARLAGAASGFTHTKLPVAPVHGPGQPVWEDEEGARTDGQQRLVVVLKDGGGGKSRRK